jgi:hypothetical protein
MEEDLQDDEFDCGAASILKRASARISEILPK